MEVHIVLGIASLGIQVCEGLLAYYDAWKAYESDIQDTYELIASSLDKFESINNCITREEPDKTKVEHVAKCLESCNAALDQLLGEEKKLQKYVDPNGSSHKARWEIRRLQYPFRASTLAKLREIVSDVRGHLQIAIDVLYLDAGKSSRTPLAPVNHRTINIEVRTQRIRRMQSVPQSDQSERIIFDWLSPPDPWTTHRSARQKYEPLTGAWLLESDQYQQWKDGSLDHIWLFGKPGCGKTILCSTAIEDIRAHCKTIADTGQAVFYFSHLDISKQIFEDLVRSLIVQLGMKEPGLSLLRQARERTDGKIPRMDELYKIMLACIASYSQVFLHLDALDECPSSSEGQPNTLNRIESLLRSAPNIKLLATSRDMPSVRSTMERVSARSISMNARAVHYDILICLTAEVLRDRKLGLIDAATRYIIPKTLTEKANGSFTWAFYQLIELKRSKTINPKAVKAGLLALPAVSDEPDPGANLHTNPDDDADLDSDVEYSESIFSAASFTSSVTSMGSTGLKLSEETISHFVDQLFCTAEISEVHKAAMQDKAIGVDKYQRNVRRMISNFGNALKSEAIVPNQLLAARILRSRNISGQAARAIVERNRPAVSDSTPDLTVTAAGFEASKERLDQGAYISEDNQSEASEDAFEDEEPQEDLAAKELRATEEFLKNSLAFTQFKVELIEFAHNPYENRVLRSITPVADILDGFSQHVLISLCSEISWVPPPLFDFRADEDHGVANFLKAIVENSIRADLDWSPLLPRKHPIPSGFLRVRWQTPCGNSRSIELPRKVANALQITLRTAPAFLHTGDLFNLKSDKKRELSSYFKTKFCEHADGNGDGNSSSRTTLISQPRATTHPQATASPSSLPKEPQKSMLSTSRVTPTQNTTTGRTFNPQHVYLCIQRGSSYQFSDLKIHELETDTKVFSALRNEYLKIKKGALHRLSIWRYSHCEFVQFSKYAMSGAPCGEGFPQASNNEYDFQPRPIEPAPPDGPISRSEFYDRFHTFCEECCHRWHQAQMRRWLPGLYDKEAVKVLPKRHMPLEMEDGKREYFWGLLVRERLSGTMIIVYVCLLNAPGIIFFFLWLFHWNHAADLQNASVPPLTSLSLTIAFVGWLYQCHENGVAKRR